MVTILTPNNFGLKNIMNDWKIISEEASIVLVGNINPRIFHPEWFIRKNIVGEWDYSDEKVINLPDVAELVIPNDKKVSVFPNKFSIRSSLATEYLPLKDLVTNVFVLLEETPIIQMGMNFAMVIKINSEEKWKQLGSQLAPQSYWEDAADYVRSLDDKKQSQLGVWELSMNLPRPDNLTGHVRAKMAVLPNEKEKHLLTFTINSHVEISDSSAATMINILEEHWGESLRLAKQIISNIMESQLRDSK